LHIGREIGLPLIYRDGLARRALLRCRQDRPAVVAKGVLSYIRGEHLDDLGMVSRGRRG
jgi:hypothetical protein